MKKKYLEFEGLPGYVLLAVVTFEDRDDRTKVTEKSVFEFVWDRDGMLRSGMAESTPMIMDRLAYLWKKAEKQVPADMGNNQDSALTRS